MREANSDLRYKFQVLYRDRNSSARFGEKLRANTIFEFEIFNLETEFVSWI